MSLPFNFDPLEHVTLQNKTSDAKDELGSNGPNDYFVRSIHNACFYVNGTIGQTKGKFLIDTGSSISVLSEKVFERSNNENVPLFPTEKRVRTADGNFLKIKGLCNIGMQLDHLIFNQEFIVANIEESFGILGINFLDAYEVDVKIDKKMLKTKLGKVKLHRSESCNRIQLCETTTVPAYSETYDKKYSCQNSSHSVSLLQPTNRYIDQGLLVARTLLDTLQDQMVNCVLNISDRNVKLKQNTALGIARPVRHVLACGKEGTVSTGKRMLGCQLHKYLQPLVDGASASLTQSEKEKLSTLKAIFPMYFTHFFICRKITWNGFPSFFEVEQCRNKSDSAIFYKHLYNKKGKISAHLGAM